MDSTSSPEALGFFGLAWTTCGAWMVIRARRHRARWAQVSGVITGLVRSRDPDSPTVRPIFRFTTLDGHEIEVTSKYGETNPPQPGDRVTILYAPRKPGHAIINTGGQRGSTMGWALTAFGLLLTTLGVLTALNIL